MAQTHTEQIISPIMTVLTTQCACQNRVNRDRSEEVSGRADCAMSAGFMESSFRLPVPSVAPPPADGASLQMAERRHGSRLYANARSISRRSNVHHLRHR